MKKRIISIMMALAMTFSIGVPFMAAEKVDDYEITQGTADEIDGVANETALEESVTGSSSILDKIIGTDDTEKEDTEDSTEDDDEEKTDIEIDDIEGKGIADLSSLTLDKKTVHPGENVKITIKTENVARIHFYYDYRTTDKETETFQTTSATMENEKGYCRYNQNTGVYTITIKIPTSAVSGEWRLHDIQMVDEDGHYSYVLRSKTDISAGDITIADGYTGRFVRHCTLQNDGDIWDGTHYYLKDGTMITDAFFSDGTYTYYLQKDGTPMKDRLTYHSNGVNIIYFDQDGHEAFDQFVNVKKSIEGNPVDDICYFDTFGYMYRDKLTYGQGDDTNLYYINSYGVLQRGGYFYFSNGDLGYAEANGALMTNQESYSPTGEPVYFNAMGHAQPR